MKNKKNILNLFTTIALLICVEQVNAAGYTFTDLGTLGGNWSIGAAINNAGQVVGTSTISASSFTPQAFLWDGGQISNLGTLGGNNSAAADINEKGQTVGFSYLYGNYGPVPTLWSNNGITSLSPDVQSFSSASGINNSGQIVGGLDNKATLWNGSNTTYLGTLGGPSGAADINNAGQIAGNSIVGNTYSLGNPITHATLWDGDRIIDLGTLGGTDSYASEINDSGSVVGISYTTGNSALHATLWNGSSIIDLGKLSGAQSSRASGINNLGQIVGESFFDDTNANFATLWDGNSIIDLNSLLDSSVVNAGWVLSEANDINDYGLIVGNAFNSKTGQSRAFLLTPVPEPSAYAMLLLGLCLVMVVSRRHKSVS